MGGTVIGEVPASEHGKGAAAKCRKETSGVATSVAYETPGVATGVAHGARGRFG